MDEIHYSEFEHPNFDAKELVQRYRKRVPLPHLQKLLRAHHAATRQELVELINEKYADFVSLSSRMQGVERALKPLRAPLEESSELTKGLHGKLGGLLQKAEDAHQGLARIRSRKEALHAYIENARLLEKVRQTTKAPMGGVLEDSKATQESIARDLRKIHLNLASVSESTECAALLLEASAVQEEFSKRLEDKLRVLLAACKRSWEAAEATSEGLPRSELLVVAHTCRALCTIGHSKLVETIFAELFVKAPLQELSNACNAAAEEAKRKALSTAEPGSKVVSGAVDLAIFFESVVKVFFTEASASPLLWFAQRFRGGTTGDEVVEVPKVKLVAYSLVLPTLKQVQEVWPNVFMPAFPDTFAANYSHFTKFLQAAEEVMEKSEALELHRDVSEFQKRWKTQVYCSLRTKEAAQRVDVAAQKLATEPMVQRHSAAGGDYWLEVSAEVLRTTELVWGAWYLNGLYPKMARLSLELVAKYGKVISTFAESSSTGTLGWDASAAHPTWEAAAVPVRLARAASDLLQVRSHLSDDTGSIAKPFLERLPSVGEQKPRELAKGLLEDAARSLQPTLAVLQDGMMKHVVSAMGTPFTAIRGIPAFYRMLNKPVPTKASPYVDSSIRPLTAFRDVLVNSAIRESEIINRWLQSMVDGAAQEFASQAKQLIEMTHQQEASLRRLAGRGGGGDDQVSDLDKIYIQLCIDVDTFIETASTVAGGSSEGLDKLKEAVAGIRRAV